MANNIPGPYQIEISYTVDTVVHKQRLNVEVSGTPAVGADPSTVDLEMRNTNTLLMDAAVDAWCTLLADRFAPTASFDSYILWKIDQDTEERSYVTSDVIAIVGVSGSATNLAHQNTLTFRTFEGGVMRIVLLEPVGTSLVRVPYSSVGAGVKAIMDFVFSDVNWILARDTSYPIAPLNSVSGQNEAVFRKRYR